MEVTATKATFKKYSAYKDSGVEWLGDIPKNWTLGKLGTLLKPVSIKGHPDLPLLSITRELGVIERNLDEDEGNHNFIPDDLSGYKVIREGQFGMNKMKAWQGSYGISRFTGIVSPAYYIFDFTSEIDPRFFHFAIRSKNYVAFFGRASDGVRIGQWDLSKSRMKEIPFFIPSPSEQTAIANFLDDKTAKIDRAIAQKERMISLLKERRQIIIQNAVTKGLDPNVKLKDSGVEWIGEIPEQWEVKKLKFALNLSNEKVLSLDSDLPYVGMENIESKSGKYIESKSEVEGLANRFKKGNILFGKLRPYLAKVYLAEFDGICSTEFLVYQSTYADYFCKLLLSDMFIQIVNASTYGAKMPRASSDFIGNLEIPIPLLEEQIAIVQETKTQSAKIDQVISLQQTQIEKLKEYKATLIDSAVTGKIKVAGV